MAQFRQGFEIFDPQQSQLRDWPGVHPGLQCQFFPMLISWMLGYPDQSLEELEAAVRSAEKIGHPLTLAGTLCHAAFGHIFRREPSMAADYAARAVQICEEQRIAHWHAFGLSIGGWALGIAGEGQKGLAQIVQAVDGIGLVASHDILLVLQAETQLAIGRPEAALASVAIGLGAIEKSGSSA